VADSVPTLRQQTATQEAQRRLSCGKNKRTGEEKRTEEKERSFFSFWLAKTHKREKKRGALFLLPTKKKKKRLSPSRRPPLSEQMRRTKDGFKFGRTFKFAKENKKKTKLQSYLKATLGAGDLR
jgi:hypothetical protein